MQFLAHATQRPAWQALRYPVAHKRNNRRWDPNIQRVRALVNGTPKRVNVCTSCIKADKITRIPHA